MTVIATSTSTTATAYPNQHKVDRCQNGVLWAVFNTNPDADFYYSTDSGATWTRAVSSQLSNAGIAISLFIDIDDYAHIVYKNSSDNKVYYRRGTPNVARTSWTWSAAHDLIGTADTGYNYPAVIAHREGTGWKAHVVVTYTAGGGNAVYYRRFNITSAHVITSDAGGGVGQFGTQNGANSWPCLDFHHNGDGKTVQGGTPHIYFAWSTTSSVDFCKNVYNAGVWTLNPIRSLDSGRRVFDSSYWMNCLFDGNRVIIAGMFFDGSQADVVLYERDIADTATVTRLLLDNTTSSDRMYFGCASYDEDDNVYLFGRNDNEAVGSYDLVYRKWTRSNTTLSAETVVDSGVGHSYSSSKRGNAGSKIEIIYLDGSASPFSVTYYSITLNVNPSTPTNLQRTGLQTDTTPNFSADISDLNTSQQIKARFEIYQSDGTTLIATVDSAFRTGAGTVTAEYGTALPVGTYKVKAKTIDDLGLESGYTSLLTFNVTTSVSKDLTLLWNIREAGIKNLTLLWNILENSAKTLTVLWRTKELSEPKDLTLRWNTNPPWEEVTENDTDWEEVYP